MVSEDKFYIYGGGRWREVDTGSGRIDGWGHARFLVVARDGKLEAVRSGRVLSALRALAGGQPSAVREGPPLPYKYPSRARAREDRAQQQHCDHCHRDNRSSSKVKPLEHKASVAIQCNSNKEAAVQTSLLQEPARPDTSKPNPVKRRRDSTSSEELFQPKVVTVATVHTPRKPPAKKHKNSTSPIQTSPKKAESSKRKHPSSSSEDSRVSAARSPNKTSLKLQKSGPLKRKRVSSNEPLVLQLKKISDEIWKADKVSKHMQPKPTTNQASLPKRTRQRSVTLVTSSDESCFETDKRIENVKKQKCSDLPEPIKRNPAPMRAAASSNTDEPSHKPTPKNVRESQTENRLQVINSQQDACKELLIDERDVEIIRLFAQKHFSDEELLRFDTDDQYKLVYFYRINPLVNVERCPQIARMIRAHSRDSRLSLIDFASKLGLKSISQLTKPKRYRTRRRPAKNDSIDDSGTNAEDKENIDKLARGTQSYTSDKVLRESFNKENKQGRGKMREQKVVGKKEKNKSKENTMDTVELSSDSGRETENRKQNTKKAERKSTALKTARAKPVISTKRGASREYSLLEDHAIVAWVSTGARANCVNGNRLWRQLQDQFKRITGHGRTWHSLRNRYLRYVLPRLGALALPHSQQARLRAGAATGELKARKKRSRRNSIFELPVFGASSRRLRPFPPTPRPARAEGTTHPGASPPRSPAPPRYSELTREFALRHRARRSSESTERSHSARDQPARTLRSRTSSQNRQFNSDERKSRSWSPHSTESSDIFSESRRQSPKRKSRQKSPTKPHRRSPNGSTTSRGDSPSESNGRKSRSPRRKSNRHFPTDSTRRKSNRRKSPETTKQRSVSRSTSRSTRQKSPSESKRKSLRISNKQRLPAESKQRLPAESKQRLPSESEQNVSPSKLLRSHNKREVSPVKRTRKLFNQRAVL